MQRTCPSSCPPLPERFRATKARRVLAALLRTGWTVKRTSGSHKTLSKEGWLNVIFAYHDNEELGPKILARIAKETGLRPDDL
jgi:predicted RNA binding protein YcfA (HicA-like mRNA interferase family)